MNPTAILVMTSIAFGVGVLSWAIPAWKYARYTEVGIFATALLFAGIIFMSMFKWSEVALDIEGAKLEIKQKDQIISELQSGLSKAQSALAQVEKKAPDTTELASTLRDAIQKAGIAIDQNKVNDIADQSLKPLKTYLDSPEWSSTTSPTLNPCIAKPEACQVTQQAPASGVTPGKPSPTFDPLISPKT
ncbi:hypothetical protein [Mesorhizobium sp.]|uniref:hypothetical protein n=1 Tax=Mesorhizobium sp. TaxID=1871066 RepID=UPI000FE479C5|nr:hypothetical protein [Mesorhizobium sp.]RWD71668.1 MAG: hypothetical protein EOS37_11225 [Mesorhizobium sp.]